MHMARRGVSAGSHHRSWTRSQKAQHFLWKNMVRSSMSTTGTTTHNSSNDEKKSNVSSKPPGPTKSSILPGVGLSAGTALAGFSTASVLSDSLSIPLSGIPVSILLGMGIRNTIMPLMNQGDETEKTKLPKSLQPGTTFATKSILQTGIVCVAAKLSVWQVWTTTATCLPVVVASVGAGLVVIPWLSSRSKAVSPELGYLLTAGTSICGVTAITALAPAIKASNRDIAVAVANTVAFGTIGMLTYPYLFHYLCNSSEAIGLCLGVGIHDTSQVLGAALSYKETFQDSVAFETAAVTKLMRNLGLAFCIPALTYSHAIKTASQEKEAKGPPPNEPTPSTIMGLNTFQKYVPPFLWAFLGVSAIRSAGDMMLGSDVVMYEQLVNFVGNDLSKYCLGTAMAGVGLSTSAASLKGVGWKPFAVGGTGALIVGGTGFAVASCVA